MSSGKYDQTAGNIKDSFGSALGNERMQGEGKTQNTKGQASETTDKMGGYAQELANQAKGAASSAMNSLTGNNSGQGEGEIRKTTGEAQRKWNSS